MDNGSLLFTTLFMCGATLVIWIITLVVCHQGAIGGLKANFWAGIRLPSTMASETAWRAAHVSGLAFVQRGAIVFIPLTLISLVLIWFNLAASALLQVVLFVAAVGWVIGMAVIANHAAKEVSSPADHNTHPIIH